jgi:hypothetical protein
MTVAYFITTLRIDHLKNSLQDSGFQIIQELSNHVRVPLLERDAQAIRALLVDAAKKANVVYASVADHKNEIIAFAGGEQKLPVTKETARKIEQITFWEGSIENHSKIVSFASDITYSGTKIGEIYLALPTTKAEKIRIGLFIFHFFDAFSQHRRDSGKIAKLFSAQSPSRYKSTTISCYLSIVRHTEDL